MWITGLEAINKQVGIRPTNDHRVVATDSPLISAGSACPRSSAIHPWQGVPHPENGQPIADGLRPISLAPRVPCGPLFQGSAIPPRHAFVPPWNEPPHIRRRRLRCPSVDERPPSDQGCARTASRARRARARWLREHPWTQATGSNLRSGRRWVPASRRALATGVPCGSARRTRSRPSEVPPERACTSCVDSSGRIDEQQGEEARPASASRRKGRRSPGCLRRSPSPRMASRHHARASRSARCEKRAGPPTISRTRRSSFVSSLSIR